MHNVFKIEIFNVPGLYLSAIGETERNTSIKLNIFRFINCCIFVLTATFMFLNFFHAKGEVYLETVQCLTHVIHVSI